MLLEELGEIDVNLERGHGFFALGKLEAKLTRATSSKRVHLSGFGEGNRMRHPRSSVVPIIGIRRADLHKPFV